MLQLTMNEGYAMKFFGIERCFRYLQIHGPAYTFLQHTA